MATTITQLQEEKEQNNSQCSEMLTETKKIENTPFMQRWEKEKGYSFGIGIYRLSEYYETEKQLLTAVKKIDYNIIQGMIAANIDATLKMYNLIK